MALPLSRRAFLLAGSAALLAACSKNKDTPVITVDDEEDDAASQQSSKLNLVLASFQTLAVADQRLAFAVIDGKTNKPLAGVGELEVSVSSQASSTFGEPVTATLHSEGIEERPYFVARLDFDAPGMHTLRVRHDGRVGQAPMTVVDPATSKIPVPGKPLLSTPTPTPTDAQGVDPICTRDPVCPWHDVSLDAALAEKRPIALLFATPALCQSSVCGPVLDILLSEAPAFADRVRFLHVEVFTDMSGKAVAPALRAYHLENEPFLFLAGADGIVRERLDGPFDRREARDALNRLTGP